MKSKIILGLLGLSVLLLSNPLGMHQGTVLAAEPQIYSWDSPKLYDSSLYGKEVRVEFTVVNSYNSGKACFLNSHENWKNYFTAVIFQSDFHKFLSEPEKYYYGKKLRVKGTLKEYRGKPQIILKSPAQIEIVKITNNYSVGNQIETVPTPPARVEKKVVAPVSGNTKTNSKDNAPMVLIPAGSLGNAYYIDKYEVTVAQYRKFCEATGRSMPSAPSWGWQDNHPIVYVSWDDATAYATYYGKRLPTEAEWEKACRAGSTTKFSFGDSESDLPDYAWYSVNSNRQTHPVGTKKPNAFGLYDMHGNVWEWCSDADGQSRVLCGGSWNFTADGCRSAIRCYNFPANCDGNSGFRCASSP